MELWIRSQDGKTLAKCEHLFIQEYTDRVAICYGLLTYGTYKNVDRALQVLDEIQNILQPRVYMVAPSIDNPKDMIEALTNGICLHTTQQVEMELKQAGQFVYQMPKE